MNAVISSSNIKPFSSALQCLARFSETFSLRASPTAERGAAQLRLSAINHTHSAFCMFLFDTDFFLRVTLAVADGRIECQLAIRPVLAILRTRATSVERCELDLADHAEQCRFSIKLHCNHGVLKIHRLTYEPKKGLLPTADPNPPHSFALHAQTAHEWTEHFLGTSKGGEITFWCGPDFCIVQSKEDEVPEVRGQMRKAIHTQVKIDPAELSDYSVNHEALLTFSLREFKATVTLAETLQVPLEISFSNGDDPLFIRLNIDSVVAEFVLATSRGQDLAETGQAGQSSEASSRTQASHGSKPSTTPASQGGQRQAQGAKGSRNAPGGTLADSQQQRSTNGGNAAQMDASSARWMPSTSRLRRSPSQADMPMESTPHPAALQGEGRQAAAATPRPLFLPGASQDSAVDAPLHEANRTVYEGKDKQEDDGYGELDDADLMAFDEVERSIRRGETELIGSQLVIRSSSGNAGGAGRATDRHESALDDRGAPYRHDSTDFPLHRPQRSAADRRIRLARIEERERAAAHGEGEVEQEDLAGAGYGEERSRGNAAMGDEDDGSESEDGETASPERKRFKPLFG